MSAFDLEQDILNCWRVTDDLDLLFKGVMEEELTKDQITNALLGMKELYGMKFEKCFRSFESHLKEVHNHVYGTVPGSDT